MPILSFMNANVVDPYVTIKTKFTEIKKLDINYDKMYLAIININKIVTIGCMFIKLFIIGILEKNQYYEPKIDREFIKKSFDVLIEKTKEKKYKNFDNVAELQEYYEQIKDTLNIGQINTKNMSYILSTEYDSLYTEITNNIIQHFGKHVHKYVKYQFTVEYENAKINKTLKEHHEQIDKIINDLFNGTRTSLPKYHNWINIHRQIIIPTSYKNSNISSDAIRNTFSYLKCMYNINKFLQNQQVKSYQIFPLRTKCYDSYITINTGALTQGRKPNECTTILRNSRCGSHPKEKRPRS